MKNAAFSIEELFRFLDAGVSAFHSTAAASAILEAEGYVNCPESAAWELAPGGKYYTTRNGSAVLAWRMPKGELTGWHAAASHSDSPTWRGPAAPKTHSFRRMRRAALCRSRHSAFPPAAWHRQRRTG